MMKRSLANDAADALVALSAYPVLTSKRKRKRQGQHGDDDDVVQESNSGVDQRTNTNTVSENESESAYEVVSVPDVRVACRGRGSFGRGWRHSVRTNGRISESASGSASKSANGSASGCGSKSANGSTNPSTCARGGGSGIDKKHEMVSLPPLSLSQPTPVMSATSAISSVCEHQLDSAFASLPMPIVASSRKGLRGTKKTQARQAMMAASTVPNNTPVALPATPLDAPLAMPPLATPLAMPLALTTHATPSATPATLSAMSEGRSLLSLPSTAATAATALVEPTNTPSHLNNFLVACYHKFLEHPLLRHHFQNPTTMLQTQQLMYNTAELYLYAECMRAASLPLQPLQPLQQTPSVQIARPPGL